MMSVGSLFTGIGGIDLGLERAGMQVAWQCENDPYAARVLAKHWPGVPNLGDITEVDWNGLVPDTDSSGRSEQRNGDGRHADGLRPTWSPVVDLVCGGFPCQDISFAGRGGGITPGSRSGLWTEYVRCLRALRPRWVLVENVPALLVRRPGMDVVAADLATLGYGIWWDCIPAAAVGAPHRRDRVWIVAHAGSPRRRQDPRGAPGDEGADAGRATQDDHELDRDGQGGRAGDVADADTGGRAWRAGELGAEGRRESADGGSGAHQGSRDPAGRDRAAGRQGRDGSAESGMGGSSDGVPAWLDGTWEEGIPRVARRVANRVDRLRCLGNAVVPQVAELIGRAILHADLEQAA